METPTAPKPVEAPREPEPRLDQAPTGAPRPDEYTSSPAPVGAAASTQARPPSYGPPSYGPPPYAPERPTPQRPRSRTPWIVGGVIAAALLLGLIVITLIALIIRMALGVGGATQSSVSTQTYQVQGTPTVVVNNSVGNVHIGIGAANTVIVQITKHARTGFGVGTQQAFDSMSANIAQQGSTITITSDFSRDVGLVGMLQGRSIDYAITLPAGSVVRADVSAGNVDAANTTGPLTLITNAGNVTATNVTFGNGSALKTNAGNVTASGSLAPGASLDVRVNAGNASLVLPATTATHLTATVNVGNLTIMGFPVSVSHDGITGHHASGDTGSNSQGSVNVTVSTGNLTITAR